MKVVVSLPQGDIRDSFFTPDVICRLESFGIVIWNDSNRQWSDSELQDKLMGADVCFTGWGTAPFTDKIIRNANSLKAIFHTGGTVAAIAQEDVYQAGIKVFSGNNVYARSVAEGVIAYALLGLRRLPYYMKEMGTKGWRDDYFNNKGLLGQTVGLVGFGSIAQHLVEFLQPFETRIKVYSSYLTEESAKGLGVERASLDDIFSTCSVISIHSAQTPKTFRMVNRQLLQSMQPGTLLINTARGNIIDEAALAEELDKGTFAAVLDVYEKEPLPMTSPLRGLDNVYLIPHMGGPTMDQRRRVTHALMDDLEKWPKGPFGHEISSNHAKQMTR